MVTVYDVILVAEDREASWRTGLKTDLFSQIAANFSPLGVTLAKRFGFRVRRSKLSSLLLRGRSDYLL